jgi:L-iditol 2-dehydrogenase
VLAAHLTGFEEIGLTEVAEPAVAPGRVLVEIERLSICGSDMRYYRSPDPGDFPFAPGYPFHECAGTVVDGGGTGFAPGERAVVLTPDRLGGAELVATGPELLVRVPPERDLAVWVLAQPIATVLYPCASLDALGKTVAVFGQGPLGLLFTQILGGMRPSELVAIDLHPYRLEQAAALGASRTVDPGADDVRVSIDELTGGLGVDIVVDTTGRAEVINTALDVVRPRGTVSCFGQPVREPIEFNYKTFSRKEIRLLPTITHARPDPTEDVRTAVDLIASGRLDVSWMVTHRLPFAEVAAAFSMSATQADGCLKVVLDV